MPPCRHTSVAPQSTASTTRRAISSRSSRYGVAAQVQRQRALGERAEAALERADVGVVDVAVADEGDGVADGLAPELVGQLGDRGDLGPAGAEQGDDLVDADLLAGAHAGQHLADRRAAGPAAQSRSTAGAEQHRRGRRRCTPGAPSGRRGARPSASDAVQHREARRRRVEPALGVGGVLGVDGEPRGQHLARGLGGRAQRARARPRPLGVTWSGVTGRHAAPVVDAGGEQRARGRVGQVRRRLQVHVGSSSEPGQRDASRGTRRAGTAARRRIAVPGLGRKFWTITSCTCPWRRCDGRDGQRGPRSARPGSRRCRRGCRW